MSKKQNPFGKCWTMREIYAHIQEENELNNMINQEIKLKGDKTMSELEKGIELIKMWREDVGEDEEQQLWLFMFDNYVAFKNGELEQFKIDRLNSINPGWIEHTENEIITTFRNAIKWA